MWKGSMMRTSWKSPLGLPAVLVAAALSACGSSEASPVSTTAAPTTAPAPLTAAELVLRADGIGPVSFGSSADEAIAVFTDALGTPALDTSTAYPTESMPGQFATADGDYDFSYPQGRRVCFDNEWCATFGGSTADSLAFVGWSLRAGDPPTLSTADGVTIGSRWADFQQVMTVDEESFGLCRNESLGQTADMLVRVEYRFDAADATADPEDPWPATIDPSKVAVLRLDAGEAEQYTSQDC